MDLVNENRGPIGKNKELNNLPNRREFVPYNPLIGENNRPN